MREPWWDVRLKIHRYQEDDGEQFYFFELHGAGPNHMAINFTTSMPESTPVERVQQNLMMRVLEAMQVFYDRQKS